MADGDKLLTIPELVEIYGATAETFRAWIATGELKAINLSRKPKSKRPRYVVRQSDLEQFFRDRETPARSERRAEVRKTPYERII